jgi:hypothetical protein
MTVAILAFCDHVTLGPDNRSRYRACTRGKQFGAMTNCTLALRE